MDDYMYFPGALKIRYTINVNLEEGLSSMISKHNCTSSCGFIFFDRYVTISKVLDFLTDIIAFEKTCTFSWNTCCGFFYIDGKPGVLCIEKSFISIVVMEDGLPINNIYQIDSAKEKLK